MRVQNMYITYKINWNLFHWISTWRLFKSSIFCNMQFVLDFFNGKFHEILAVFNLKHNGIMDYS